MAMSEVEGLMPKVVVMISQSPDLNMFRIAYHFGAMQEFNVRFASMVIGESMNDIIHPSCLNVHVDSSVTLLVDLKYHAKLASILVHLAKNKDGNMQMMNPQLCKNIEMAAKSQLMRLQDGAIFLERAAATTTSVDDVEEEGILDDVVANIEPVTETEMNSQEMKDYLNDIGAAEHDREDQDEEIFEAEHYEIREPEPEEVITTTTLKPVTTTKVENLKCFVCDNCHHFLDDAPGQVTCKGTKETHRCFTARVGIGRGVSYVRGCETRQECVDVDSPLLKRKCCNSEFCNDDGPQAWEPNAVRKNPKPVVKAAATESTPTSSTLQMAVGDAYCYRTDGAKDPETMEVEKCDRSKSSGCFISKVGMADDVIYLRGCADNVCVDVDTPVLKRKCCTGDLCNEKGPYKWMKRAPVKHSMWANIESPVIETTTRRETTTKKKEQLACFECDNCGEVPNSSNAVHCGDSETSACYIAQISTGKSMMLVRGCELKSECQDLETAAMKRHCCTDKLCNALAPIHWPKPANGLATTKKPRKKITLPPIFHQTTTARPFPSVEEAKARVEHLPSDIGYPLSEMDLYLVLDFATMTRDEERDLVKMAKKLAVESAMRGAEVAIVNGDDIKRISPYQIALIFDSFKRHPTIEEVLNRFDAELHVSSETKSEGRRHIHFSTTTSSPESICTLPSTFESLVRIR